MFAFWNTLATDFYDLEIDLVYPNTSLKEAFALLFRHYFRLDIEYVGIQLVDVFFPDVGEVVLADFRRLECEWLDAAQVFEIFLRKRDLGQRWRWEESDLFETLVVVIKNKARGTMVFSGDFSSDSYRLNKGITLKRILG